MYHQRRVEHAAGGPGRRLIDDRSDRLGDPLHGDQRITVFAGHLAGAGHLGSSKGASACGSVPLGLVPVGPGCVGGVAFGGDFPDLHTGTLSITVVELGIPSASASSRVIVTLSSHFCDCRDGSGSAGRFCGGIGQRRSIVSRRNCPILTISGVLVGCTIRRRWQLRRDRDRRNPGDGYR